MSMSMTSGRVAAASATPSAPFAGLADELEVGLGGDQHADAGAEQRLVVDEGDADAVAHAGHRRAGPAATDAHDEPVPVRDRRSACPRQRRALAHAGDAVAGGQLDVRPRGASARRALEMVSSRPSDRPGEARPGPRHRCRRGGARWSATPARCGRRRAAGPAPRAQRRPGDLARDGEPGRAQLLEQPIEVDERRLRARRPGCGAAGRAARARRRAPRAPSSRSW